MKFLIKKWAPTHAHTTRRRSWGCSSGLHPSLSLSSRSHHSLSLSLPVLISLCRHAQSLVPKPVSTRLPIRFVVRDANKASHPQSHQQTPVPRVDRAGVAHLVLAGGPIAGHRLPALARGLHGLPAQPTIVADAKRRLKGLDERLLRVVC